MKRFEEWTIAYRKREENTFLIDDHKREFSIVKNTWRYWCADPHLFELNDVTYLFAELYDRVLRRGVIGCCEITDEGCSPWKVVLKMPWHLSYPHVFTYDNKVFMIPESYVGEEIALFEAEIFPTKWKKVRTLKSNCVAVDSTLFVAGQKQWLQTLEFQEGHEIFNIYAVEKDYLDKKAFQIAVDDVNKRPAGKLFYYKNKLIRPAQDCTKSYGCALNFFEVLNVSNESYEEKLFAKVFPDEIQSDFCGVPQGIHTYNLSDKYEVIDLKSYEIDWLFYIMRPLRFIGRKIKRLIFGK